MIEIYNKAEELTEGWDDIAVCNPILLRSNLEILEKCNPCSQKYVVFKNNDNIAGILVSYKLHLNIFTYTRFSLKLPITIIGAPCSVSSRGYVLGENCGKGFSEYIAGLKGARMVLNAEEGLELPDFFKGYTLPSCIMNISWENLEDYLQSLRSHYRYRYNRALKKFKGVTVEKLANNSDFTPEMYKLYEQVYDKSNYKLEKLSIEFFRNFPSDIYVFYESGSPIAFVQLAQREDRLMFLFGGMEYSLNGKYDTYINMLLFILKTGIEAGASILDFGQTAEDAKVKLGCRLENKFMYVSHSNPVMAWLVRRFGHFLSYEVPVFDFNQFKIRV